MTHPRRILIIRLSHLGDVVQALPLYHALAAA
jgi:ADP-heptose:LPS heptosyltransferase